ncbi:MAG: DUF1697 domain-containing protein [Chloroflexi bacterium]|nr:DUF1697 domain-containing protein [Chloroflexota bacterium]
MPVLISFLRGINVGGHKKIKMAELRGLYTSLGLLDTRTILQSGNAIFKTDQTDLALVQVRIEEGIRDQFGFDVRVMLRGTADFRSIFDHHPFTDEQCSETKKMVIVFLSDCPSLDDVDKLRASNPGREFIHADGNELFVFYTDGQARSKLDNSRIERALGLASTARNWNTCQRLLKLLDEYEL